MLKPLYASGNSRLITRKLNAAGTDYEGESKKWFDVDGGDELVSTSATFTYTPTNHPSGNNPAHVTTYPEPTGTGTLTLFFIGNKDWSELTNVEYYAEWGVGFAPDKEPIQFGFAFDINISDGSKTKIFVPRCQVTGIPEISSTTNTESGVTIQQVALPIQIFSIYRNGKRLPIYFKMNSVDNPIGYSELQDNIRLPITNGML